MLISLSECIIVYFDLLYSYIFRLGPGKNELYDDGKLVCIGIV